MEEIIATGSRIPRSSAELPTPTTVIDAAVLERSGAANLGDVLHGYPALVAGVGSNGNNDQGSGIDTAGLELLNLRGLGPNRTLVLVNGRRHVPGDSGTTAVDISMIPPALIERVDIITGGASAIYGADAVAGVVNIILKDHFDGLRLDVLGGISAENDGESYDLTMTFGRNVAAGRGNVFVSLNHADENGIPVTARAYANRTPAYIANSADTGPDDGVPALLFFNDVRFRPLSQEGILHLVNNATTNPFLPMQDVAFRLPLLPDDPLGLVSDPVLSAGLEAGQPLFDSLTFDRISGEVRPFVSGSVCDVPRCSDGDGFRPSETNMLSSPLERTVANMGGHYDFDGVTVSARAAFGRVESFATGQGFVVHAAGALPYVRIERDNPFLPATMTAAMDARGLTAAPLAVLGLTSSADSRRDTWQVTLAGSGDFDDHLSFDVYGQYGEVDAEIELADVLLSRYFQALDATTDEDSNPVCRDPANDCVPLNPFNRGGSAEARAFTDAGLETTTHLTQLLFGFSVGGQGWGLPAGTLRYAAGVEYRRESSEFLPDELMQARDPVTGNGLGLIGLTRGPTPELNRYFLPVVGEYSVGEVFGEVLIPIVSDRTWLKKIDLDLAARYSDYDIVESSWTYNAGLNWAVTDSFRLRGTYSRAVRAPNIRELFAPPSTSIQFVIDPCDRDWLTLGRNPENRQANCAALGLPPDFESLSEFGTVTSQGNPGLTEESADTATAGAVITIRDKFDVALDYWDIDIHDAIVRFDASQTLANCVDGVTLDPVFCSMVTRSPDGQIVNVDRRDINSGQLEGRGIDLEANYFVGLSREGFLRFNLTGSYIDEMTFTPNAADRGTQDKLAGTQNRPRVRALFRTIYDIDRWQLGWDVTYVGSSKIFAGVQPEQLSVNRIESKTYHSVNARYRFHDGLEIFGGVRNITNERPPPWKNYGGILYDAVGRFYFAGVRMTYQ